MRKPWIRRKCERAVLLAMALCAMALCALPGAVEARSRRTTEAGHMLPPASAYGVRPTTGFTSVGGRIAGGAVWRRQAAAWDQYYSSTDLYGDPFYSARWRYGARGFYAGAYLRALAALRGAGPPHVYERTQAPAPLRGRVHGRFQPLN